jgi:hypothetical protein
VAYREIVQDAAGEWIERNSALQLQEKWRDDKHVGEIDGQLALAILSDSWCWREPRFPPGRKGDPGDHQLAAGGLPR